jgi:hypothetical protein
VNPWETESQPMLIHRPSRQICFILFGRTISPHDMEWPDLRRARAA